MESRPQPTEIAIDSAQGQMSVTWRDGHVSVYALAYLRASCPCASCETEGQASLSTTSEVIPLIPVNEMGRQDELTAVEPVGRYAISFAWGDGHDTGIYTYSYLRSLCQCRECLGL